MKQYLQKLERAPNPVIKIVDCLEDTEESTKAGLHIRVRDFKSEVQIGTKGKVQVYVNDIDEKPIIHEVLEKILQKKLTPKQIISMQRNVLLKENFPLAKEISFPACKDWFVYKLNRINPYTQQLLPQSVSKVFLACSILATLFFGTVTIITAFPEWTMFTLVVLFNMLLISGKIFWKKLTS